MIVVCRSQWPRGLKLGSAAARSFKLQVRIPQGAWMSVCCECCVLSGRGMCVRLITRPEESYRLWCIVECDLKTSRMRKPFPALGRSATKKSKRIPFIFNDERTGTCICLRLDLYMSHVKNMCHSGLLLFLSLFSYPSPTRSHTCDCVRRRKNNICFYLCSTTPSTTRFHTCA
jgi:hypothetical protein